MTEHTAPPGGAEPDRNAPAIAVVVVTHNSSHAIGSWVDAIDATGLRSRLELCVVDSGSTPEEQAFLTDQISARVDALELHPNLGYGRSCNEGAKGTRAPVLLFTNPDTQLLTVPSSVLDRRSTGGRILGAVKVQDDGAHKSLGFKQVPTFKHELASLALGRLHKPLERSVEASAWVSGAALMISRDDFDHLEGYTWQLFMYYEDADLCVRHVAAGGSVEVHGELAVRHASGNSSLVDDMRLLARSLDSVGRLSARTYLEQHGHRWHRGVLYLALLLIYVPRQAVVPVVLGGNRPRLSLSDVLDLLFAHRVLRRLEVPALRRRPSAEATHAV